MKRGLTPAEWLEVREENQSLTQEAVTAITPFTGLSSVVLAHLRESWIEYAEDTVRITVPTTDSCNEYRSIGGDYAGLPMLEERSRPCVDCRNNGRTDGFENRVHGDSDKAERVIIHRKLAEPAVEFIKTVFKTHDRPEIGVTSTSLCEAAQKAMNSESDRGYMRLRRTAPVIYAHYGLSMKEIEKTTVYGESAIRKIISKVPEVSIKNIDTPAFLRVVSEKEPVTVERLASEFDRGLRDIYTRLEKLREANRVEVTNNGMGPPAAEWRTAGDWKKQFQCDECGYTTYSLNGINVHREQWCN